MQASNQGSGGDDADVVIIFLVELARGRTMIVEYVVYCSISVRFLLSTRTNNIALPNFFR